MFSLAELRAKQNAASSKNGVVGRIGNTTPTMASPKQIRPHPAQMQRKMRLTENIAVSFAESSATPLALFGVSTMKFSRASRAVRRLPRLSEQKYNVTYILLHEAYLLP